MLDDRNGVGFYFDSLDYLFGVLGYTTTLSDVYTGELYEADILLNDMFDLSMTEETELEFYREGEYGFLVLVGVVNLPDVITHEIGHFCGLSHTFVDDCDPSGDPH